MSESVKCQLLIDQLPDEMLEKVFEMLDSESIEKCLLVSQRWETVIGQSSKVMKQLPLVLDGSFYDTGLWLEKKTFFSILQKANRKFHTIIFKKVHYWDKNALELLSKHGSESHWIKFVQCSIVHNHLEVFHKILESFRNVEKITFDATHFNLNQPRNHLKEIKPVNLPRLRSVVWSACSFLSLKFTQLKSLKISDSSRFVAGGKNLIAFLATQTKLEELALRKMDMNLELIELSDIEKIKIPLKRLSLDLPDVTKEELLLAFLSRFVGTLEELELKGSCQNSVYEMVFKKFIKLKVVTISVENLPTENVFYNNLCPSNATRKLIVEGADGINGAFLERFIGNLLNIETLVLMGGVFTGELLQFVSNNLRHLKSLHVLSATGRTFERAQLPSVTTISFDYMRIMTSHEWTQVVKALPNVETFSVKEMCQVSSLSSRVFNIFTKGWPNLTHVKVGKGFVAFKGKFNRLLRNCKKIQTVELAESAFVGEDTKSNILRDFKKDGLRLIIHADDNIHTIFHQANGLWSNEHLGQYAYRE